MTAEWRENQSICSPADIKYSKAFHLGNRGTICNPLLSDPLVFARLHQRIDASLWNTVSPPWKLNTTRFLVLSNVDVTRIVQRQETILKTIISQMMTQIAKRCIGRNFSLMMWTNVDYDKNHEIRFVINRADYLCLNDVYEIVRVTFRR